MTFVAAFRYGRGVVLASDSRAVSGASAEEEAQADISRTARGRWTSPRRAAPGTARS